MLPLIEWSAHKNIINALWHCKHKYFQILQFYLTNEALIISPIKIFSHIVAMQYISHDGMNPEHACMHAIAVNYKKC